MRNLLLILFIGLNCIWVSDSIAQQPANFLKTTQESVEITDQNKKLLGKTPFDLNLLNPDAKSLTLSKEGYESLEILLDNKPKGGYVFPGPSMKCEPCLMSFNNYPTADKKEIISGSLRLRKKFEEYDKNLMISIDTPVIDMSPNKELGSINGSSHDLDDKDIHRIIGYVENMDFQVVNALKDSYLEVYYLASFNKELTNMYKPKVILKPYITNLHFNFKGSLLRDYTGPCQIECTWKISTIGSPGKVIGEIPLKTSIYRSPDNYEIILHQMIAESEKDLLEVDSLYDYISKIEKSYLLSTIPKPFNLKKVSTAKYASSKEMLKTISGSVVTVENDEGFGSGVLISTDGYILTNYHVVEKTKNLTVRFGQGKKIKAEIVNSNSDFDIALLKIESNGLYALPFGESDGAQPGDEVFAIGTPLDKSLTQSVTRGIVSGFREWNGVKFIQTDVSINAGNSGGPLINESGEIIGITTMKISGKGIEGIGFCIPSDEIIEMMNIKLN